MTISVGERIPGVTLYRMGSSGPEAVSSDDLFKGKKVALFGVPGAFTPTCSAQHLPGFIQKAGDLQSKGVDEIVCIAVNDAFVMDAWGQQQGAGDKVTMVADGDGEFAKATGLELDLTGKGLGLRCQRFSMLVDDGTVKSVNLEADGGYEVTSAEHMLAAV